MTIRGAFRSRGRITGKHTSSQIFSFMGHGKGDGWREGGFLFPPLGPTVDALLEVPL